MKQQQVYNLKEFAARHHLESIFGAYAAHIYIDDLCEKDFIEMAQERTLFTKLVLVTRGNINMGVLQQGTEANDSDRTLSAGELLVVSPKHVIAFPGCRGILRRSVSWWMRRLRQTWCISCRLTSRKLPSISFT